MGAHKNMWELHTKYNEAVLLWTMVFGAAQASKLQKNGSTHEYMGAAHKVQRGGAGVDNGVWCS